MQYKILIILATTLMLSSCISEIELDLPEVEQEYVVEGYIEQNFPPIVLVTKTEDYFAPTSLDRIQDLFVHDAIVTINSGNRIDTLVEIGSDTLRPYIDFIRDSLGVEFELGLFEDFDVFIYTTPFLLGRVGGTYDLSVKVDEDHILTGTTRILPPVPFDSLWIEPHPNPEIDSLRIVRSSFTDVAGRRDYFRLAVSTNLGPFYTSFNRSVWDDYSLVDLDGKRIVLPIERTFNPYETITDFEAYSYYAKGDTVIVKLSAIDQAHYNFWMSVEYARSNQGNPFGRAVDVNSNISGGYGIWGGYGSTYELIIVE